MGYFKSSINCFYIIWLYYRYSLWRYFKNINKNLYIIKFYGNLNNWTAQDFIKGTFYAYILPAIKRASQALGRALRSKEDNALFILGDKRYINFIRYLPDFIQKNLKIISNSNDMIKEIKNFKNI